MLSLWRWLTGPADDDLDALVRIPDLDWWQWYLVGIVVTYGYAFNTHKIIDASGSDMTPLATIFTALFWPLFWSTEVFSWILP